MSQQLDDLAGLANEADAAVSASAAPADQAPANEAPDYLQAATVMVDMAAAFITGYAPAAQAVWTADAKKNIVITLAPVLEKYNMTADNLPPELALAIMAGPVLYQSLKCILAQRAVQARASITEVRETAAAAPQAPEGPGTHAQMGLYQ